MRLALALCLALAACSADPILTLPDAATADTGPAQVCTPGAQVACTCVGGATGAQVCSSDGRSLGACECPDAGSGFDAGSDAGVIDSGPRDTGAGDAGQPDAGGGDVGVDVVDAGRCPNGPRAMCDGRYVDLVSGETDGGLVHHCGACGTTCAAGEVCDACRCAR